MIPKISAFIITKNEGKNIEDCIKSLMWADEIIIVDDFSDDLTEEVCKKYSIKFFKNRFTGFRDQKKIAMSLTSNDWVLELDADERVSLEMRKSIENIKLTDFEIYHGFEFKRKNYFWGKWIKHCGLYPDYKLRLYNKKKGIWSEQNIHERFIVGGPTKKIDSDILHYQTMDLKTFFQKTIKYNFLSAQELKKNGKKAKWHNYTLRPIYTFLYRYFFRLGFLDGIEGFIVSVMGATGTFAKYMFLKELERNEKG